MKMYDIKIEAISPMLHHGAQNVGMEEPKTRKKGGQALQGDPEEWKQTIYFDSKYGVYLPASCIEASLCNAAKQFKVTGRQTASNYFKSGVFANDEFLDFRVNGKKITSLDEIEVDKRTAKNPATRMRNTRYRAIFRNWSSNFRLTVASDDFISKEILKDVITYAGMFIGVGDYRPRFGRFKLIEIKEVKA